MVALELSRIIKDILKTNNFVSLPGIGSFTQVYMPATLSPDGVTFNPPRQVIGFDRTRVFNDGAIENYLTLHLGIILPEAEQITGKFIEGIRREMDMGDKVEFLGVGSLSINANAEIEFKPIQPNEGATSTFGLESLTLQPRRIAKDTQVTSPHIVRNEKTKKVSRAPLVATILISILALSSLAVFFAPRVKFGKDSPDKRIAAKVAGAQTHIIDTPADSAPGFMGNPNMRDTATKGSGLDALSAEKRKALYYQEPKPADNRLYHIVAGSFTGLHRAEKHLSTLIEKGFRAEIVEGKGNYRVTIARFSDRTRALAELERYKRENPGATFWVMLQ